NDQAIEVVVKEERDQQLITKIIDLQEQAANDKPKLATLADTLSQYVVIGILLLASATYLGWYFIAPENALWYALAVLVATCPCALSLATPSAYTAATTRLQQFGLLAKQGKTLDTLTQIDHICFDKTGTLTTGEFSINAISSQRNTDEILAIIATIEAHSNHPIAQVFSSHYDASLEAKNVNTVQGSGISAMVDGCYYFVGSQRFVERHCAESNFNSPSESSNHSVIIFLADEQKIIACVELSDQIRSESNALIVNLHDQAIKTSMLTGDNSANADYVAQQLAIDDIKQGQSPTDKLEYLKGLQQQGAIVAMFGDGVNDAPVLSQAHLSFAMGTGADIAKSSADIVILHNDLSAISKSIILAKRTKRIIKQNFCWALGYNLTAVPFAIAGYLPPYVAAIGMSISSIIVVTNSLRLLKVK
ncbi:MAG: heavy metal translocating P-type ATPase, partial [Psychrobium sp.]